MRDTGGADPQSAFLRAVVVGPAETSLLTVDLDRMLRDAGHDVTLLTGASTVGSTGHGNLRTQRAKSAESRSAGAHSGAAPTWPPWAAPAPAPRAGLLVAWSRLDTWARTGRRLRGVDVIVLVHSGARSVPALLSLLHGAGATGSGHDRGGRPRMVLVAAAPLTYPGGSGRPGRTAPTGRTGPTSRTAPTGRTGLRAWDVGDRLTAALVQRVDAVLVHDDETAAVATELGADRVRVTARPVCRPEQPVGGSPGVMPASSTASSTASGVAGSRVTLSAVVHEVRRGLSVGSRFASSGLTTHVWRQPHTRRLDLERTPAESAPGRRTTSEQAAGLPTAGLPTAGLTAAGLTPAGSTAAGSTTAGPPAVVRPSSLVGPADAEHPAGATGFSADDRDREPDTALSAEWAHYVGVLESLASPLTSGWPVTGRRDAGDTGDVGDVGDVGDGGDVGADPDVLRPLTARLTAVATRSRELVDLVLAPGTRPAQVPLRRSDLPDWVVPTDVLVDAADGDEAKVVARGLGLPRVRDGAQAWSALGALAAIIRIVDDGHRSAVVVDESGSRSPLTRWARAVGFAPVSLGLGGPHADLASVDLEIETLDVIARVHPGGCDVDDVDEIIGSSSWLLRPGGILVVTLPLGPADAPGAIAPADVRGVVARAHGFGFALVGDLDGELSALMTAAASAAPSADTAYGLVRLTFRRQ